MAAKRALITGISGQDGSYLAEYLLERAYEVHGLIRTSASPTTDNIRHILPRLRLHAAPFDDVSVLSELIATIQPDECYHLAAQTFAGADRALELETIRTNVSGTHNLLCAIRDRARDCRIFYAGSNEMFGHALESPQTETTSFHPRSIYGISKVAGYHLAKQYRTAYGMHISCGMLYNHESPRRQMRFVTRKITAAAAAIKAGRENQLHLGDLDAVRDWGHARDYVEAMWAMVRKPDPDDYIIATGVGRTVRDFLTLAFQYVGLDWNEYVVCDPSLFRAPESLPFVGCADKAKRKLAWSPRREFASIVKEMVDADLDRLRIG